MCFFTEITKINQRIIEHVNAYKIHDTGDVFKSKRHF